MGIRSNLLVWFAALLVSTIAAVVITAELVGLRLLPEAYASLVQDGPVTRAIIAIFEISLVVNASNTVYLIRELGHVRTGVVPEGADNRLRVTGNGLLGRHVRRLYEIYEDSPAPDARQDASLNAIRNQLFRREWLVRSASQLLLTLGLIGTVLGLTESLSGLSSTVHAVGLETLSASSRPDADHTIHEERLDAPAENPENASTEISQDADETTVSDGLNKALGGMATAFLTTLFGAVLGGVFLKLLHSCTESLVEHIVDEIELLTETHVMPALRPSLDELLRRQIERFEQWSKAFDSAAEKELERLSQISKQIAAVTRHFAGLADSIAEAQAQLMQSPAHLIRMAKLELIAIRRRTPVYVAAAAGCVLVIAGVVRIVVDLFP